ncbi:hypothetical protein L5515_005903 [Caenorhabditis briggsae]|uniref:G-protein coupled receptors family 1 profile domain-containing protein n=1 Tax=Caenorhabditis briggsae TaxID=6238 RepID=A0AAE9JHI0_CAEBR|nr:hypothetical protein L5515_005903 [Caenorhabditis briggsae]
MKWWTVTSVLHRDTLALREVLTIKLGMDYKADTNFDSWCEEDGSFKNRIECANEPMSIQKAFQDHLKSLFHYSKTFQLYLSVKCKGQLPNITKLRRSQHVVEMRYPDTPRSYSVSTEMDFTCRVNGNLIRQTIEFAEYDPNEPEKRPEHFVVDVPYVGSTQQTYPLRDRSFVVGQYRGPTMIIVLIITTLYFLFNIFHLTILTRPAMRTQSVSKEMICIALCGVLSGVIGVIKSVFEVHEHFGTCHHSYRYYVVGLIYFLAYQIINQFILWLIIYITFLRAMIIPIFIMIVLTIFLVIELRSPDPVKSAENTKKQINATYGLVAFLFCYIFAELPYVFLFALGLINPSDFVQLDEYIYSQVDAFICSSMCIGIIIYAMMSAQYRDTICATFCRSHKISPGPSVFLRD